MKQIKIATSAFAAALLAACNPGASETAETQQTKQTAQELQESKIAADSEAAGRLVDACMSKSYDDLEPKLKYTDEAPQDFKDYYKAKAERCVNSNKGQFFNLTYDRSVLEQLSDKAFEAEITALETKTEPKYPTRAQVKSLLTSNRR